MLQREVALIVIGIVSKQERRVKKAWGAIVVVGVAVVLSSFLPMRPHGPAAIATFSPPTSNSVPAFTGSKMPRNAVGADGLAPAAFSDPKPSVRVQTSTDVFALFNELKSAQFGTSKETAEARYAAMMAVDQCSKYTRPEIYQGILDQIESQPAGDVNKARRLEAYRFDMDRCRGFRGWSVDRIVAEKRALLAEAAQLGSAAARVNVAAARYFDEGGPKKPEVEAAILRELTRIAPDGNGTTLNAAGDFIAYFPDSYFYVSEPSGERYSARLTAIALHSIACEQGGMCEARHSGSNTVNCWAGNECGTPAPDEYIQREVLPPAQYERFLALRQELLANFAAGRWPAGFWANVRSPPVKIGTARNE